MSIRPRTVHSMCCGLLTVCWSPWIGAQTLVESKGTTSSKHDNQGAAAEVDEQPPTEVVVRGRRRLMRASSKSMTGASSVLEGEQLHAAGASSADVLSQVPGVQVARRGAQSDVATASIRGSGGNQVPVYVAGIRINDDVSGTANLSTVPLWMMERVEVFRGNAPEQADRLGIGGAIFFTPRLPRKNSLGIGGTVGSYGLLEGWLGAEVAADGAGSLVAVRRSQAENDFLFKNDQGQRFDVEERLERRENTDTTEHEAWAIGRFRLGKGAQVTTVMQGFEREQGVTGIAVQPAQSARGNTRRVLFGVSSRVPCDATEYCVLHLNSALLLGQLRLTDPLLELPAARSPVLQNTGERFTQSGRLVLRTGERTKLSLGALQSLENLRINRTNGVSHRASRASTRASAQFDWQLHEGITTQVLAAAECHTTDGVAERFGQPVVQQSGACGVFQPVGRVGVKYSPGVDVDILANAGRYLRLPTLGELYGTSSLVSGNAELIPETGWSADVGTRLAWSKKRGFPLRFALDGFVFGRWVDELIRYRRSSLKTVTPFNVASARYLGAELAAVVELLSVVTSKTVATLLDPRETTDDPALDPTTNDILPLTSGLVLTQSLTLETRVPWSTLSLDAAALTLRYQHRASRFADSAGQVVLPEQNFVDVEASSKFFDERLRLRFALRNLFNQRTSDLLGLPLPGRTYAMSLECWL